MVFISCAGCGKRMDARSPRLVRAKKPICLDCYISRLIAFELGLIREEEEGCGTTITDRSLMT